MKRRFTTLAAMLLLTGALVVGMLGIASAQNEVHEANGMWHHSGNGQVSFKITWKGVVHVTWKHWIKPTGKDVDPDDVDARVPVDSWVVTATDDDGNVKTKTIQIVPPTSEDVTDSEGNEGIGYTGTKGVVRHARFGNLTMGKDYTVVVKGLDGDDTELGQQQVIIRPRHITPPEAVTGLTLSVGDDNLSVAADWTAPAAGGQPKRYIVWLTNLDTGHARSKTINLLTNEDDEAELKTNTVFKKLWPGDDYRVSVRTLNRNSLWKRGSDGHHDRWHKSEWTQGTITMPSGDAPSYDKKAPTLVWVSVLARGTAEKAQRAGEDAKYVKYLKAQEQVPPYAIGEPTAYIIVDAKGSYVRFDAPNECLNYQDPHGFFLDEDNNAAAKAAILKAESQMRHFVKPARVALATAVAAKSEYQRDTPEAEQSRAKLAEMDLDIARKQREVDATEQNLAVLVAKLETECARAYPAEENLTEADDRWYQAAQDKEIEKPER